MTHIPDLVPVSYAKFRGAVRAVGWLEAPHPYPRGPVEPEFEAALRELARYHYNLSAVPSMGVYFCSLCEAEGKVGPASGTSQHELLVPADDCAYETPIWILHYVVVHGYRPPDEFRRAVLTGPPPGSEAFRLSLQPYIREDVWEFTDGLKYFAVVPVEPMLTPSPENGNRTEWLRRVSGKRRLE